MKTKAPAIKPPKQSYPGEGYNHTLEPNVRIQQFRCPCGHIIVISIKHVVEVESTIATCPNCESWHSILWKYPSGDFILCGKT